MNIQVAAAAVGTYTHFPYLTEDSAAHFYDARRETARERAFVGKVVGVGCWIWIWVWEWSVRLQLRWVRHRDHVCWLLGWRFVHGRSERVLGCLERRC